MGKGGEHVTEAAADATHKPLTITVKGVYGRHVAVSCAPQVPESTLTSKQVFERRRLDTHKNEEGQVIGPEGPNRAYFIPGDGLVGHDMYHTNYGKRNFAFEERAVLVQSIETYLQLARSDQVGQYLHMYHADTEEESIELILAQPNFGEQLIVQGCDQSQVCIGDVFEVLGGGSTLQLQVTSPRYPCNFVDRKFESPFGAKGMRRYTLDHAAAGWFCRVLAKGQLVDGMQMARTANPNPEWPLTRCAAALYGKKANCLKYNVARPSWSETIDTLREFVSLGQLGDEEWRAEATSLLTKMEHAAKEELQAEEKAMSESESWCSTPFSDINAAIGACACLSPVVLGMLFDWNSVFG